MTASNAGDLRVAWIYPTGGETGAQYTPIYYDGLLYFAQDNTVYAVDAAMGRQVWKYAHELPEDFGGYSVPFFTGKHRGVAIAGEHIYFLSNNMKLHAMHCKAGEQKFVQQYLDYPKAFEKSEDARLFRHRRTPGDSRTDHRTDERHGHRRSARICLRRRSGGRVNPV